MTVNDTENTNNPAVLAKMTVCKSKGNEINVRENRQGQTRMDNPEKLATLGTQHTRRGQTKQKKRYTQSSINNVNRT